MSQTDKPPAGPPAVGPDGKPIQGAPQPPDHPGDGAKPGNPPDVKADKGTTKDTKFTHYCNCKICTGKSPGDPAYGVTTDGSTAGTGTLAAPKTYSFGTTVTWTDPQGGTHTGTIEDRGGKIKGNRIDIWVPTHAEAIKLGTYTVPATFTPPAE